MAKLVTLEEWARCLYGDAAPEVCTLRRWARTARIYPAAEKHGRSYFVAPDAVYVNHAAGGAGSLLERIKSDARKETRRQKTGVA